MLRNVNGANRRLQHFAPLELTVCLRPGRAGVICGLTPLALCTPGILREADDDGDLNNLPAHYIHYTLGVRRTRPVHRGHFRSWRAIPTIALEKGNTTENTPRSCAS